MTALDVDQPLPDMPEPVPPFVRFEVVIEAVRADGERGRFPNPFPIPMDCLICAKPILSGDGMVSRGSLATHNGQLGMACESHRPQVPGRLT